MIPTEKNPMKLDAKFYGEIRKVKDDSVVPDDEYVIFLAKDNAFAAVLPEYRLKCLVLGADQEQIKAVDRLMQRVALWRKLHPSKLKVPDAAGEKLLRMTAPLRPQSAEQLETVFSELRESEKQRGILTRCVGILRGRIGMLLAEIGKLSPNAHDRICRKLAKDKSELKELHRGGQTTAAEDFIYPFAEQLIRQAYLNNNRFVIGNAVEVEAQELARQLAGQLEACARAVAASTPQATCPECGAKSQLTLTATGPWIYVTCGACRQWWGIGEIEHTPYFFGGEPASNGPRKVMTCSVDGCTNPSRWQSRCEFHLNEANSATKPGSTVAAPQNSERPWIKCSTTMPANNEVVETKIDEGAGVRNEQTLKRQGNLWFLPDGSMHVYYCPTHWRPVNGPRATM